MQGLTLNHSERGEWTGSLRTGRFRCEHCCSGICWNTAWITIHKIYTAVAMKKLQSTEPCHLFKGKRILCIDHPNAAPSLKGCHLSLELLTRLLLKAERQPSVYAFQESSILMSHYGRVNTWYWACPRVTFRTVHLQKALNSARKIKYSWRRMQTACRRGALRESLLVTTQSWIPYQRKLKN